ncbi:MULTISPECIES: low molecular weight phosphatase family protein [Pseudonocardia]|uniref:arsenate-mycothiol transferase ArsC n=1 Tax=Pseudonocardia TaxID=1847 RepID=UPI001AD7483A|nr:MULTISPECIES: low molecular weight phosphatase family protein [Pseudonocardia]MBO4236215.1 hypothetical protein [Pseudonocardia alni]
MTATPSVLFVCVRNGGRSRMAAGLMRAAARDRVEVHSAGTSPGTAVNALSAQVLDESGADITGETPTPIDPELLRRVDLVGDAAPVVSSRSPPGAHRSRRSS